MNRTAMAISLATALLGATAACSSSGGKLPIAAPATTAQATLSTFHLLGQFTLKLGAFERLTDTTCTGYEGYSDIAEGTTVTVSDQTGTIIATGRLVGGTTSPGSGICMFRIDVPDTPDGKTFCQVEVSHRGKQTYSAEQAKGDGIAQILG